MPKEVVSSQTASIEFDGQRCIHSRNCVLDRPDVLFPMSGVSGFTEHATDTELLEIAHNCPSGAIQCKHVDGTSLEKTPVIESAPCA